MLSNFIKIAIMAVLGYCFGYALGLQVAKADTLFTKNDSVTCSYYGVFSYTSGIQFVEQTKVNCKVVSASDSLDYLQPGYQHIQLDCTKDVDAKSTNRPGVGMIRNHKLNYKTIWLNSNNCYHKVG